jgi:CheY-like chemotaxis protein
MWKFPAVSKSLTVARLDLLKGLTPQVHQSGNPLICLADCNGRRDASSLAGSHILSYAPQILVVEDEPAVRNLLDRALAEDGYLVTAVGTARQALQAVRDAAFEVIILDMSLPDADGLDVLRQIRLDIPEVQVLAFSGMMVGAMLSLARAAGADATLAKPTTSRKLREVVYGLLDLGLKCAGSPN